MPERDACPGEDSAVADVHRWAAQESGDEDVRRSRVDLVGCTDLLQAAPVEDRDPIGHRHGVDLVVGDVQHGGGESLVQPDELCSGLVTKCRIEVGQRFVHEEGGRLPYRSAEAGTNPLPLATGELGRFAVEQWLDVEHAADLPDPPAPFGRLDPVRLQREHDVPGHRHVGVSA